MKFGTSSMGKLALSKFPMNDGGTFLCAFGKWENSSWRNVSIGHHRRGSRLPTPAESRPSELSGNLARLMEIIIVQIIVRGVKHLMVSNTSVMQVNWFSDLIGEKMRGFRNTYEEITHKIKTKAINVYSRAA